MVTVVHMMLLLLLLLLLVHPCLLLSHLLFPELLYLMQPLLFHLHHPVGVLSLLAAPSRPGVHVGGHHEGVRKRMLLLLLDMLSQPHARHIVGH